MSRRTRFRRNPVWAAADRAEKKWRPLEILEDVEISLLSLLSSSNCFEERDRQRSPRPKPWHLAFETLLFVVSECLRSTFRMKWRPCQLRHAMRLEDLETMKRRCLLAKNSHTKTMSKGRLPCSNLFESSSISFTELWVGTWGTHSQKPKTTGHPQPPQHIAEIQSEKCSQFSKFESWLLGLFNFLLLNGNRLCSAGPRWRIAFTAQRS